MKPSKPSLTNLLASLFSGLPASPLARLYQQAHTQDCFLCGTASPAPLCTDCRADLPRLPAALCPACALPANAGQMCGRCLRDEPAYDATHAALAYAYPLDGAIQAFKYRGALGLAPTFAALMDEGLEPPPGTAIDPLAGIDLLLPTPLSNAHLAERGYNQAHELARALARRRDLALDPLALIRTRQGPAQAELPWKERARNIRGAFAATRRFDGLHVAVIDDVMTTGATLGEIAKTLKAAGAARVSNWVLARTLPAEMAPVRS